MKKTKYLLFLLFMLAICVVNVKAFDVYWDGKSYEYLWGRRVPNKYITGTTTRVYCSEFWREPPDTCKESGNSNWTTNDLHKRVIGEIINSEYSYEEKEILINVYLAYVGYSYDDRRGVVYISPNDESTYCQTVNNKLYCGVSARVLTINIGGTTYKNYISLLQSAKATIDEKISDMEARAKNKMNNSVQIKSIKDFKYSNGQFKTTIKVDNFDGTNVSVSGAGMNCTVTKNNNLEYFDVSCTYLGTEDSVNMKITATRTVSYYTSVRHECTKAGNTAQQVFTSKTETSTSEVTDNLTKTLDTTQQACNNKIQNNNKFGKVGIYNDYKSKGYDWRKILNFNNSSCDVFKTNYKKTRDCNNINIEVDDFNESNVSGYQETTTIGDKPAYCTVEFKYNNVIPRSAMFDAGRIIFQDLENLGTGYLQKRCYAYGTEIPIGNTERWNLGDFNVSSYIKGISILDQELEQTIVGNLDKFHNTDNEFIVRYNLKYIKLNYLEKVNGLPTTRKWCSKNVGECIERKGIVTKFEEEKNDETIYTKRFYPEVSLAGSYADQAREDYKPKLTDEKGVACNYKFNKIQIKDNKPNLVFRIIDTKNPFSGKTGNGRVIGSNWCEGGYACTSEGIEDYSELKLIQDNIINKPNSSGLNYDGTTATPKYTIDLNYNTMQSIREYNKKHNYNSFEQKCDETGECSSKFIKEYLK